MDSEFILYLRTTGRSKTTIANYCCVLNAALRVVGSSSEKKTWMEFLSTKLDEISAAGVNKYIKVLKAYGRFKGWEWVEELKKLPVKHKIKHILTDEEIRRVIEIHPPPDKYGMLFMIMAYTGARSGEVAYLRSEHIDFTTHSIIFNVSKTDPRRVSMHSALEHRLRHYIAKLDNEYLFTKKGGNDPPTHPAINKQFKHRVIQAGINKKCTVHSIRHSFITDLLNNDANLIDVQRQVGHKKADTTAVYRHNSLKALHNAVNKLSLGKNSLELSDQLKLVVDEIKKSGILDNKHIHHEITEKSIKIEIRVAENMDSKKSACVALKDNKVGSLAVAIKY